LDVHCHTISSGHAYSTISENAAHAAKIGLTHIGIADHAPGLTGGAHLFHFANLWSLPDVINGVRVFKGAECSIMNIDGKLDLPDDVLGRMEFVIASMHRPAFPPSDRERHTRAMIAAMESQNMHILGHPGDFWYDIDVEAVIEAAARTRTIIEINNNSLNPGSIRFHGNDALVKILELCKQHNVPVLASSDAHFSTYVGELSRAKALIEAVGLDESLVLNTCEKRFLSAIENKRQVLAAQSQQA